MNSYLLSLVIFWSSFYHVDPYVTLNVIRVESSYRVSAVGKAGEIGLMQLLPESFPKYSKEQLFDPNRNIQLGVKYLSECKQRCVHQTGNDWLVCFNSGITGGNKIKYPMYSSYLRKYK